MKKTLLILLLCAVVVSRVSAATVVSFVYSGTDGVNTQTTAQGSFSFANSALSTVTLSDLTTFTLHQTVNSGSGAAIGFFDFTKTNLTSFSISLANNQVTAAAFQTAFKLQTSSPTGTTFKSQDFIALSATTAKTQYRDQFFPIPPPPSDETAGPIQFVVPEPSSILLVLCGITIFALIKRPNPYERCQVRE